MHLGLGYIACDCIYYCECILECGLGGAVNIREG